MDQHLIGVSANGQDVYINLMQAPVSVAVSRNPHLLNLIKEIVAKSELTMRKLVLTCDLKREVGYADTVVSNDGDTIFYARELKAKAYTRFVKNRDPERTSIVSLHLDRTGPKQYTVTQVRLGAAVPPLPGSDAETAKSRAYWASHAVVYTGQPIMASTLTRDNPYDTEAASDSAETPAGKTVAA